MKIAISANMNTIEAQFSQRFGRCDFFILIDSETRAWEAFHNPAASARGGAGPQAVQFIADKGSEAIISGRYGPSAFTALEAAGIKAYLAEDGTVNEVLDKFLADELESTTAATGPELHGRG
ncbi:MAG: NifB/NifX family molybdenum-iron cluster-binding protein [Anaerolineales bacterium]|nr:NifB/NifX family molybdenum-iron cluster-binding protein [Anaerolineales bacterium]